MSAGINGQRRLSDPLKPQVPLSLETWVSGIEFKSSVTQQAPLTTELSLPLSLPSLPLPLLPSFYIFLA